MPLALTDDQKDAIWFVLRHNFGADVKVWVFGSRAEGVATGDIDLYAEVPDSTERVLIPRERAREQMETLLFEKVDLIVRRQNDEKTPFDEAAKINGVMLPE